MSGTIYKTIKRETKDLCSKVLTPNNVDLNDIEKNIHKLDLVYCLESADYTTNLEDITSEFSNEKHKSLNVREFYKYFNELRNISPNYRYYIFKDDKVYSNPSDLTYKMTDVTDKIIYNLYLQYLSIFINSGLTFKGHFAIKALDYPTSIHIHYQDKHLYIKSKYILILTKVDYSVL